MRIRGGHVAGAIVLGISAFVIYAALSTPTTPETGSETTASLPPLGADPALVPMIELTPGELHLGRIPNKGLARGTVTVRNGGKAALVISDVRTSCACTAGEIPEKYRSIPPGGEGLIEIVVDPARITGFHSRKNLTVYSNDPVNSRVEFTVAADVDPEFAVIPERLSLGTLRKGAVQTFEVQFRQLEENPLELTAVRALPAIANGPWTDLAASLRAAPATEWQSPDKAEFVVRVTLPEDVPAGKLARVIECTTNLGRIPAYHLEVEANVEAPYTVTPSYPQLLALVSTSKEPRPSGTITVTGNASITLDGLVVDCPAVTATQRTAAPERTQSVDVSLSGAAPPGKTDCTVRFVVKTAEGDFREWVAVRVMNGSLRNLSEPSP